MTKIDGPAKPAAATLLSATQTSINHLEAE
jgi:hypothetical protein